MLFACRALRAALMWATNRLGAEAYVRQRISSIIKCNTLICRVYAIHTFNHGGEDQDSGVAGARKIAATHSQGAWSPALDDREGGAAQQLRQPVSGAPRQGAGAQPCEKYLPLPAGSGRTCAGIRHREIEGGVVSRADRGAH